MNQQIKTSTQIIADFISLLKYRDIPENAIKVAKNALLDWIGVTVAGSMEKGVSILSDYVRRTESRKEATVICQGIKTTAELAALVNGTMGHAIDFDDTSPESAHYNLHPSAAVIPAILSVTDKYRLTGKKFLASYVSGMEVMSRIGSAIGAATSKAGWHPTPVLGSIGTVAGCANLLELDQNKAQNAVGIAASLAGGLVNNFGSMTKPFHAGNAARNGVFAAELASAGFTSGNAILDGDSNFCQLFSEHQVTGMDGAESDLGKEWKLVTQGVAFKLYPSCRSTHTSIEAALYLRKEHNIDLNQIDSITCKINLHHLKMAKFHNPETGYQGKFSIPYCIVTALSNGRIVLGDFTDDYVNNPLRKKVMSKVSIEPLETAKSGVVELTAELIVALENGSRYSRKVSFPKGDPTNPMTASELKEKFEYCSLMRLRQSDVDLLYDYTRKLETIDDLTPFFMALGNASK